MTVDRKLASPATATGVAARALLVALAYYGGAQIGFQLKLPSIPTSIFWLPNATMFAVFLLTPLSRWWLYALAALPAHVAVQLSHQVPPATIALLFVSNLADGAIAALAIRRLSRGRAPFEGFREVVLFLVFAVATPLLVSFADAAVVTMTGWGHDFRLIWHTRFRSNVLTNIIWVPAVVIGATRGAGWLKAAGWQVLFEVGMLALGLGAIGFSIFGPFAPHVVTVLLLLPFPLLLWAAVRFGAGV